VKQPFPVTWRETLERRVKFYRRLDDAGRRRFEDDVRVFLAEQRIRAAGGAQLDDDARLLVAASAATLGHGMPELEWPRNREIVIHAANFDARYEQGPEDPEASGLEGADSISISGPDLRSGYKKRSDGRNVGLREMAHVLDRADGVANGVPLGVGADPHWLAIVSARLKRLRKRHYKGVLDRFGGASEAELFAVAVEAFFERPKKLRHRDPELYEMLRDYFRIDPARLSSPRSSSPPSPD
jgi:Mlc titration factor MtfA (ptsG expression regulator)